MGMYDDVWGFDTMCIYIYIYVYVYTYTYTYTCTYTYDTQFSLKGILKETRNPSLIVVI